MLLEPCAGVAAGVVVSELGLPELDVLEPFEESVVAGAEVAEEASAGVAGGCVDVWSLGVEVSLVEVLVLDGGLVEPLEVVWAGAAEVEVVVEGPEEVELELEVESELEVTLASGVEFVFVAATTCGDMLDFGAAGFGEAGASGGGGAAVVVA